jgi:hypothetical protein
MRGSASDQNKEWRREKEGRQVWLKETDDLMEYEGPVIGREAGETEHRAASMYCWRKQGTHKEASEHQ